MMRIGTLLTLSVFLASTGCGEKEATNTPEPAPREEPATPEEPETPPEEPEAPPEEPPEVIVEREDQTDLECEDDDVTCPTFDWMEANFNDAMDARDTAAIALALHKVEFMAPVPEWNDGPNGWSQLARRGAVAAEAGDFDTARQACRGCHVLFPEEGNSFRKQFRSIGYRTDARAELPEGAEAGNPDLVVAEPAE